MKKITIFVCVLLLWGCKSSDEKLLDACIEGLESRLEDFAKYGGWDTSGAVAYLHKMEPDIERNQKFDTDQFYLFEVLIGDFTVRNGFNADVKSVSTCTGYVSKSRDDKYDPPSDSMLKFDLNGNKLGW